MITQNKKEQQGSNLSQNLINLYCKIILRKLQDLPGFIIDEHSFNNINYADDKILKENKI